jgi:hypothetical protein
MPLVTMHLSAIEVGKRFPPIPTLEHQDPLSLVGCRNGRRLNMAHPTGRETRPSPSDPPLCVHYIEATCLTERRPSRQIAARATHSHPPDVYRFYGTDAAHLWHTGGIPGVVSGPGGKHTTAPDEAMEIDELLKAARIYALAILDVCG